MSVKNTKIAEIEENLDDLTACSICRETFTEPKILSCLHTFCKNCLQGYATKTQKSSMGEEVPCPICRKKFSIPEEGFDGLQKNFFMEKLMETKCILSSFSNRNMCEACLAEDPSVDAGDLPQSEVYCVDCHEKLCKECHKYHVKKKLTENHRVIGLDEQEKLAESVTRRVTPEFCVEHDGQPLNIYCSSCMDAVCALCFVENHESHKGSSVDSVVDELQKKIQDDFHDLSEFGAELDLKCKNLGKDKIEFIEKMNELEIEIKKIRDESLKEMENYKEDIELLSISVDNFKTYCKQLMTIGSSTNICKEIKSINNRSAELRELCQSHVKVTFEFPRLQLERRTRQTPEDSIDEGDDGLIYYDAMEEAVDETRLFKISKEMEESKRELEKKIKDLEQQVVLLRSIALGESPDNKCADSIDFKTKPKSSKTFSSISQNSGTWSVMGMTILGNEFFIVVSTDSIVIEVYDLKNFHFKRRWSDKRLIQIKDAKSCKKNKCLYFLNETAVGHKNEIVKFDLNGVLVKSWSVDNAIGQLSITDETNVLFTVWNKTMLQEYSSEGQLERSIPLTWNYGFSNIWHAIKLNSSHYLVSHGTSSDYLRRICIIDTNGIVLSYFGTKDEGHTLLCPIYMEKDKDNNIIVVDSSLRLLKVLGPNLKQLDVSFYEFVDDDRFLYFGGNRPCPQKLVIDEMNRNIFVVHHNFDYTRDSYKNIYVSSVKNLVDTVIVLTV